MSNELECPVPIGYIFAAMARGEARPFTKSDFQAYAGVENDDCYLIDFPDNVQVVLDIGPLTTFSVFQYNEATGDMNAWNWDPANDWQVVI